MHDLNSQSVECLEITHEGELIGYAIWFSGGWDVYRLTLAPDGKMDLKEVATNVQKKDDAIGLLRD